MNIAVLFFAFFCISARAENPTAYQVYSKLLEEGVDSSVRYSEGIVEGWNFVRTGVFSDLLNLMSPSSDTLDEFVQSLAPKKRELFLREFFSREKKEWGEFLAREKERGDVPLDSVSKDTAHNIFYGEFPGLEGKGLQSTFDKKWNFVPSVKSQAEQYVSEFSFLGKEQQVWMVTFKEQKSYGDLQDLIRWSRKLLNLPSFSHSYDSEYTAVIGGKLASKQKIIGFYLSKIAVLYAGYKNPFSFHFYTSIIVARTLSQDLSGTGGIYSLDRIQPRTLPAAPELASRFGVSLETAEKALVHLDSAIDFYGDKKFLLPLSSWQNISRLGRPKREALETLARIFLERSARVKGNRESKMARMLHLQHRWVEAAFITEDMEFKLAPKPGGPVGKMLNFETPSAGKNIVDVNQVALGVEYTGRFPVNHDVLNPFPWSRERRKLMRDLARELSLQLRGSGKVYKKAGGHGHGLGYSYAFLDGKGRSWSVDWDGIRRKYDEAGKIKKGSVGGGHLEVASAKFVPKVWEIEAVYKIFKKFSIIPHRLGGAGHINVDLSPFEGRPRAMARFLALFHQYQSLIEFMFYGEEFDFPVREKLAAKLRDFAGSESELKEWLYNERYFYSLLNAKTRYAPVNIIPYFQEVIPREFLAEDVDQFNPTIPWKPRFRFVAPEEKRMELRFFDAPKNPFESALHIRFVRAMLHAAFNEDFPIGPPSGEDTSPHLEGPKKAFAKLEALCQTLKLDCQHYRPLLAERLSEWDIRQQLVDENSIEQITKSAARKINIFSQTLENDHIWGRAVSCNQQARRLLDGA